MQSSTEAVSSADTASAPSGGIAAKAKKELMATAAMCHHCFDVLIDALQNPKQHNHHHNHNNHNKRNNLATSTPTFVTELDDVSIECPLFVTWDKQKDPPKKRRHNHNQEDTNNKNITWNLRGCIGTLSPRLLTTSIGEYALISALRDRRFHPVSLNEVSSLRVCVSLLLKYELCNNVYDWIVGIHGITIKFVIQNVQYNATYLPEVAKEQNWDQIKTVSSLIQKAGYHGKVTDSLLSTIHCTRYQSSKQRVTFHEYVSQTKGKDGYEHILHLQHPPHVVHGHPEQLQHLAASPRDPRNNHRQWNSCNNL